MPLIILEALAAREACFEVALVVRPGNISLSEDAKSRFRQIETFSNIHADLSTTWLLIRFLLLADYFDLYQINKNS